MLRLDLASSPHDATDNRRGLRLGGLCRNGRIMNGLYSTVFYLGTPWLPVLGKFLGTALFLFVADGCRD